MILSSDDSDCSFDFGTENNIPKSRKKIVKKNVNSTTNTHSIVIASSSEEEIQKVSPKYTSSTDTPQKTQGGCFDLDFNMSD